MVTYKDISPEDTERRIKKFVFSHYLHEGIKISFCMLLAVLLFLYLGDLHTGVNVCTGILIAFAPDMVGPIKERRNAMSLTILLVFLLSFIAQSVNNYPILIGVFLAIISFCSSIVSIYGIRASAVGSICLIIFIQRMGISGTSILDSFFQSLIISSGAAWYCIVSLSITRFRPYQLAKQILANYLTSVAEYIRIKAEYYTANANNDLIFSKLLNKQVTINENQESVQKILLTNKVLMRENTKIGRLLAFLFIDTIDIFESAMSSHQDYKLVQDQYRNTRSFHSIHLLLHKIANEMDNLAYQITTHSKLYKKYNLNTDLVKLYTELEMLEQKGKNTVILKKTVISIRKIINKIEAFYDFYNTKDINSTEGRFKENIKYLATPTDNIEKLTNHLNLDSGTFRHALRLMIVMSIAYIISFQIPNNHHIFWVLLTIAVILRPNYSLTKKRNFERLKGTFIGGILGILTLFFIDNGILLFIILFAFMILTYTYIRHNYALGSLFLTAFILISYSFISTEDHLNILEDRMIDTTIGCAMAFISTYIIFPNWEGKNIQTSLEKTLIANLNYISLIFNHLMERKIDLAEYRLARKEVYLNTANITSILQRMISEPKKKQKSVKELNNFNVFSNLLISYSSALLDIYNQKENVTFDNNDIKLMRKSLFKLSQAIVLLGGEETDVAFESKIKNTSVETDVNDSILLKNLINLIYELCKSLNQISKEIGKSGESLKRLQD